MEQGTQPEHKRRVRYKGKYPKKFEEKYKELQPEKYQDTVAHVISKPLYFTVYLQILNMGVKLFVGELTASFKGISDKLLPGAAVSYTHLINH